MTPTGDRQETGSPSSPLYHAAARRMHEEALGAAQAIDNHYLQAQVLDMLGLGAATVGHTATARERFAAGAELHIRLLDYEGSA